MVKIEQKFIMMSGVTGSGKTAIVKALWGGRDDIKYIVADNYHTLEDALNDIRRGLDDGIHVIYESSNTTRNMRSEVIEGIPKHIYKTILFASTDYCDIVQQCENREVPTSLKDIDKMYVNVELPVYGEGWDEIRYYHHDNVANSDYPKQFSDAVEAGVVLGREEHYLMEFLSSYFVEFAKIHEVPHDSVDHRLSISRHTYYMYRAILDNESLHDSENKKTLLWATLLQSIGKPFVESYKDGEDTMMYARYDNYTNVSSQMAIPFLHRLGYGDPFIYEVVTLIQFLESAKSDKELIALVGEDTLDDLALLWHAQKSAQ